MGIIAVIGGTGVYDPSMFENIQKKTMNTPYGEITYTEGSYKGKQVVFLARHGSDHSIPPHMINYRANIWGLKKLGVTVIVSTTAVGSLNENYKPGHFVLIDQFLDFTKVRANTFFDGNGKKVVHLGVGNPYAPEIRAHIEEAAHELNIDIHNGGTYVCTEGPRFETPAEIKMYHMLGADTVGMTNVPEVVLAGEAEIAYATISMVTNFAAGISPTELTHQEVLDIMQEMSDKFKALILRTIEKIDPNEDLPSHHRLEEYGGFKVALGKEGELL
ncbi:MAG: S-methyl-5'-thioadenosine phosphorylase [Veillonella sp.]|uniref:S-methyl-5'-thioadenosine phosphorylase n=1 Tax=Veillonella sp. TaxID=1926307 RepID=UPI0025EE041F|nr:S-methyl-5'-thioadenosine phosphorylase [Veillonella sp.]MBS4912786.1 S-methyl-5'-thioadenosine phosphorylase [Veillonella sp.]